jgi:hypothetical protein
MLNNEGVKPLSEGSTMSKPGKVDSKTKKYPQDSLAHLHDAWAVIEPAVTHYTHVFCEDRDESEKTDF